jgi:hypothetical protein
MRGGDERSGSLQLRRSRRAGWQGSSAAGNPRDCERGAFDPFRRVLGALFAERPSLDPTGEAPSGDAVAGFLFDPLGTTVDGSAGVRPAFSLVRRHRRRRYGVHSTFSKNRERLLEGDLAAKLLSAVMAQPRVKRLLSTDHFSVDGALVEAWASMKSFRPKDGSSDPPTAGGGRNREQIFTVRSARTRRTLRRPTRNRGFIARGRARRRSSASWATR